MYKKLTISIITLLSIIFLSCYCFAVDINSTANGIQNTVKGAENAVQNAAQDFSNATQNMTNSIENKANSITDNIMSNGNTAMVNRNTNNVNGNYSAVRTSTTQNQSTLLGMNASTWTWFIIGLAAIAIIALVWYYAAQNNKNKYEDND